MERWRAIGIRPPLDIVERRGTYLGETSGDVRGMLSNFYLSCSVDVGRAASMVIVTMGELRVMIIINRARRVSTIREVVQAALDNPTVTYTYLAHSGLSLLVESDTITVEQTGRNTSYDIAILPMCIDLVEALVAAEAAA